VVSLPPAVDPMVVHYCATSWIAADLVHVFWQV